MEDKLNISIRIADLKPIPMEIRRDEEPNIRAAESQVNNLWKNWKLRFPEKTSNEVLGMVAFQFAKTFVIFNSREDQIKKMLDDFEKNLDKILLDVGGENPGQELLDL